METSDVIDFMNALRRGEKPKPQGKRLPLENRRPMPVSEGDREAVRVLDLILRGIALGEPIPRKEWHLLGQLICSMHEIKGLKSVGFRGLDEGVVKAADMEVRSLVKFLPLRAGGQDLYVGLQARLSEEFREFCLQLAYSILLLVEDLPKAGRPPIGVCRKCGDFFPMVYFGKPKKFCSIRCKSLFRSM